MRKEIIEALKKHAEGHIKTHTKCRSVIRENTSGIADDPDTLESHQRTSKIMIYDDQLEILSENIFNE